MRFAKWHGIGNDFVLFADPDDGLEITQELAARICDRRFGVGADGVIRVAPGTEGGDFFMDYWNSDGSVGEMCGNGIRCMALFAQEEGLTSADELQIETRSGRKVVLVEKGGRVRVDMGPPGFPADGIRIGVPVDGRNYEAACVSMGNPHAVFFVDDPADVPLREIGPRIEQHELFPGGANVEFMRVISPDKIEMRVWERGSGETLACGTGACAVAVIGRVLGGTNEKVTVAQPGGEVEVEWAGSQEQEQPVFMTGPAEKSFEGEIDLDSYR